MALTQEQQIIFDAVIASLRTNSKTIEDLTPQTSLGSNDWFELNGGRKVSYAVLSALIKSLSSTDHDSHETRINKNVLKAVSFDVSESAATLTVESNGKTVSCSVPVATATASGIITALDKVKIQSAYENAQAAQASADAAQETADAAKTAAQGAQGALKTLNDRVIAMGGTVADNTTAINQLIGRIDGHDEGLSNLQMNVQAVDEKAEAAKTAAQGAQGAVNSLNQRVLALGNTVSGHTTAISNLTESVDEQYTALQGCHELIGTNDAKIHSIGIVPFDGLYDADNVPATGVWFRRYGADEGGACVMWSADGEFPAGFSEHDYNVTFHGFKNIRTDRVFRLDNRLYRFDGNGLVEVGRDPRQVFNDMWDSAWGTFGKYDPANAPDAEHPYLGNGIWMTYEEAVNVYNASVTNLRLCLPRNEAYIRQSGLRTVLPFLEAGMQLNWKQTFHSCSGLEAVSSFGDIDANDARNMFYNCQKLKKVLSYISLENCASTVDMFYHCYALEYVVFNTINCNISLADSPLWNFGSVQETIQRRASHQTKPITITVNPAVYAKLTGDTTNAAAAALTDEEAAAWQGLVTAAAAKNISFATV